MAKQAPRKIVFKRDGTVTLNGQKVGEYVNLGTHWIFKTLSGVTRSAPTQHELRPHVY